MTVIPIIDLFAGPGGLGEGFSQLVAEDGTHPFKVKLSIEMDEWAHRTLELRSLFRQFQSNEVPDQYYRYLRGECSRDLLFSLFPAQAETARHEAIRAELGKTDHETISSYIRTAIGSSDNWLLIGGPPCQAYSVMGRSRMRGQSRQERKKFREDERHFLYREYLRIIAEFKPPVFVMENVKGILSSTVGKLNIFRRILLDLSGPTKAIGSKEQTELTNVSKVDTLKKRPYVKREYKIYSLVVRKNNSTELVPEDFIIRSEEYGIPQARHRVILLGVRADIAVTPDVLTRHLDSMSVDSAISDLPPIRSALSQQRDSETDWYNTIQSSLTTPWIDQIRNPAVREVVARTAVEIPRDLTTGGEFIPWATNPAIAREWFYDYRLSGVCNHTARAHMASDLHRYFFASCYARVHGDTPTMRDFPEALLPKHSNIQKAVDEGVFDDRFRVQSGIKPSTTITCHMAKDGHYSIHPNPSQCRSLTVREAARLQTFPDNYFFEGSRTQQYKQVGNAVPPLLAFQIAGVVHTLFTTEARKAQQRFLQSKAGVQTLGAAV